MEIFIFQIFRQYTKIMQIYKIYSSVHEFSGEFDIMAEMKRWLKIISGNKRTRLFSQNSEQFDINPKVVINFQSCNFEFLNQNKQC